MPYFRANNFAHSVIRKLIRIGKYLIFDCNNLDNMSLNLVVFFGEYPTVYTVFLFVRTF